MELPPIDHAGWGRLLSAVLSDSAAGQPTPPEILIDATDEDARRRAAQARTTVHATSKDVYA